MNQNPFPILEYDPDRWAILRPELVVKDIGAPKTCVLCFFPKAIAAALERYPHRAVGTIQSEDVNLPVYAVEFQEQALCLVQARVGGPCAAAQMEELFAMGCRNFIACGSCGVFDETLAAGHVIVPTAAVRDEGTSYHYLPPSRQVELDAALVAVMEATLTEAGIPYITGTTWTNDAIYRETPARIAKRLAEGCVAVEMECASWAAVAGFLGAGFGQLLYAGDVTVGGQWDMRNFGELHDAREQLLHLALCVAAKL